MKIALIILGTAYFASAIPINTPRALPTPVTAATARTYLASLTVEPESDSPAYDRDLFPHWHIVSGTCDTRETVLKRDGTSVVTDSSCKTTSGKWVSPYDGVSATLASDLDIDHLVPLKEAWVSGARLWTTAQREAFANDLTRPQLVAVTDNLNQAKGDQGTKLFVSNIRPLNLGCVIPDPATWVPPLASYVCTYVRAYVQVKHFYNLSVDSAEKTALTQRLANC